MDLAERESVVHIFSDVACVWSEAPSRILFLLSDRWTYRALETTRALGGFIAEQLLYSRLLCYIYSLYIFFALPEGK